MDNIYLRLEVLGFSKEFIKSIGLPSWWCEELDNSANMAVIYEGVGHIATNLFLDLKSMLDIDSKIKFKYNMTYSDVINSLKTKQKNYKELQSLGIDVISSDISDNLERLLEYEFK